MVQGIEAKTIKKTELPEGYITISKFAKLINQNSNSIYQGIRLGRIGKDQIAYWHPPKTKRNILIVKESAIDSFVNSARAKLITPGKPSAPRNIDENINKEYIDKLEDLAQVKAHREKLHAQRQELELQRAKNELITVSRVEQLLEDMAVHIRQSLLALVPRVVPIMTAETDIHTNMATLQNEIEEILTNIIKIEDVIN